MLFKFRMADCKSVLTPLDRTVKLRPDTGRVCDPTRFRQIVGSLIYLTITRPDLSYPVEVISVEYQCIMVVFTLSSLIAQVRAICVISIKGSCPK